MARIHRGVWVKRRRVINSFHTQFWVKGNSGSAYIVNVDEQGLYTCSCRGNKFHWSCYHVLMLKTELERIKLVRELEQLKPKPISVDDPDFTKYMRLPRFVSEPIYPGPRMYVVFGCWVYLGIHRKRSWEVGDYTRLAGTVIEGTWDNYGVRKGRGIFRVFDCPIYKGIDYRLSPLGIRRDMAEKVIKEWKPKSVELGEWEYTPEGKQVLMGKWGCCVLKDVNSTYALEGKSPRAWMIKGGRKKYGKDRKARARAKAAAAAQAAKCRCKHTPGGAKRKPKKRNRRGKGRG